MKSYLLLRDNQESGPYTLEDIRKNGLLPQDLIWIEGESTCWRFPDEIEELTGYIKPPEKKKPKKQKSNSAQSLTVAKSTNEVSEPVLEQASTTYTANTEAQDPYDAEAKELFADFRLQSTVKRRYTFSTNLVALLVLAIGVAMTAYVVRSIVLSFGNEPMQSAQATEIQSVSYEAEHAAYGNAQPEVQHAIFREVIPVAPVQEATTATEENADAAKEEAQTTKEATPEPEVPRQPDVKEADPVVPEQKAVKEDVAVKKEEPKEEKPVNVKRSDVKVSANNYKVGLLGGISDFSLQVSNNSSSTVGKAVVEVKYLKKNGNVVHTETVQVQNIKPGASKTVQVPASSRGVKVDYRVVNVEGDSK